VGELQFTDRKWKNWSLQIESGRTGVCTLIFFEQIRNWTLLLFVQFFRGGPKFVSPPPLR